MQHVCTIVIGPFKTRQSSKYFMVEKREETPLSMTQKLRNNDSKFKSLPSKILHHVSQCCTVNCTYFTKYFGEKVLQEVSLYNLLNIFRLHSNRDGLLVIVYWLFWMSTGYGLWDVVLIPVCVRICVFDFLYMYCNNFVQYEKDMIAHEQGHQTKWYRRCFTFFTATVVHWGSTNCHQGLPHRTPS